MGSADDFGEVVSVLPGFGEDRLIVICEHASNRVPDEFRGLGLNDELLQSHIAWDPGARGVAQSLADCTSARLVAGGVSRLIYDCNRPPEAPSAIPVKSERHDIPGNVDLTEAQRQARTDNVFVPFHAEVEKQISALGSRLKLLVTVHSFSPNYLDQDRAVEVGVLHGRDDRFARQMMENLPVGWDRDVRLNEPYSASDGVAYTLDRHGWANDLMSVMLEIRNDLIATSESQKQMSETLAIWVLAVLAKLRAEAA